MPMVHLQLLAQISSCSFGDLLQVLMDQSEMQVSKSTINMKPCLPLDATAAQIRMALKVWDFPLIAYPRKILDAKLEWYIPGPNADDITVDLQRQVFIVDLIDGTYYSCWNSDDFPLGDVHMLSNKCYTKGNGFMKGYNHTSATDAWLHAQQVLHDQLCTMEPAEQVQFLAGKPEPVRCLSVARTSSSVATMEQAEPVEPSPVGPLEPAKPVMLMAAARKSSSQASAAAHLADASNPFIVIQKMVDDMENKLWLSYMCMHSSCEWECVAPQNIQR